MYGSALVLSRYAQDVHVSTRDSYTLLVICAICVFGGQADVGRAAAQTCACLVVVVYMRLVCDDVIMCTTVVYTRTRSVFILVGWYLYPH